ncbi:hypothetical protein SEMRO_1335_G263890.1 [Seminavis robusta]|uniref:Uncharacterized protein n=1 Tax=Seminavis robusta TaxID=568900 RepID=A0A9N8HU13_9STRA|nr:hypothetical protein SEMRO_1335_G263890.1 [Seminavis robusta]|eukprot:Sro1335_g263890.1 n/a (163) ;mRNA; f:1292-1780
MEQAYTRKPTLTHFKEFFRDAENVARPKPLSAPQATPTSQRNYQDTQTLPPGLYAHPPQLIDIATITRIVQESLRESQAANATTTTTTDRPTDAPLPEPTPRSLVSRQPNSMHGMVLDSRLLPNPAHNSDTCNFPKEGHNIQATAQNKMGGSNERYQPRRGN